MDMTDEDAFFVSETVELDSNVNTNSSAESPSSEIKTMRLMKKLQSIEAKRKRRPKNLRDAKKVESSSDEKEAGENQDAEKRWEELYYDLLITKLGTVWKLLRPSWYPHPHASLIEEVTERVRLAPTNDEDLGTLNVIHKLILPQSKDSGEAKSQLRLVKKLEPGSCLDKREE